MLEFDKTKQYFLSFLYVLCSSSKVAFDFVFLALDLDFKIRNTNFIADNKKVIKFI